MPTLSRPQARVFQSSKRFRILIAGRRFGKTFLSVAELLRGASWPGFTVWYIAPTYRQAKQIAWSRLKEIADPLIVKRNETDLSVDLSTGGRIALRGADNYDSLRGVGLDGVVLDEFADIAPEVWSEVLRPALADRMGWALFIGCVGGNTSVLSASKGMVQISEYSTGSPDKTLDGLSENLYGLNRTIHTADGFWNNGVVPTKIIQSHYGFRLEASHPHPVLIMGIDGVPVWRQSKDLRVGDRIAIGRGMEVWPGIDPCEGIDENLNAYRASLTPRGRGHLKPFPQLRMTNDLAYFLGLWMAEGSFEGRIGRITITCGDSSVGRFLTEEMQAYGLHFRPRGKRTDQWAANSFQFVKFMEYIGMPLCKAPMKTLPAWVSSGKREWAQHFVAGAWDGDGYCSKTRCRIGYTSSSERLIAQLQLLLSNFGVIARKTTLDTEPTRRVKASSTQHILTVTGPGINTFKQSVPLRIQRKIDAISSQQVSKISRRDGIPFQAKLISAVAAGCKGSHNRVVKRGYHEGKDITAATLMRVCDAYGLTLNQGELEILKQNVSDNYYWDRIASIEDGEDVTYDFTIPDTHSFWSNGFISHNTPKGYNVAHKMYMEAQDKPDWDVFRYTTLEGGQVPSSEVDAAREELDPKTFRQEFEASFESTGVGKLYYAFDREQNVKPVIYNPALPLMWSNDFNLNPMSSVICQIRDNAPTLYTSTQATREMMVLQEIVLEDSNVPEACSEFKQRALKYSNGRPLQVRIYGDSSGNSRNHIGSTDYQVIRQSFAGDPRFAISEHIATKNPEVKDRVNAVNSLLLSANGNRRLTIDPSCKELITDLEQVVWKMDASGNSTGLIDKRDSKRTHVSDAMSYCLEKEFPLSRGVAGYKATRII